MSILGSKATVMKKKFKQQFKDEEDPKAEDPESAAPPMASTPYNWGIQGKIHLLALLAGSLLSLIIVLILTESAWCDGLNINIAGVPVPFSSCGDYWSALEGIYNTTLPGNSVRSMSAIIYLIFFAVVAVGIIGNIALALIAGVVMEAIVALLMLIGLLMDMVFLASTGGGGVDTAIDARNVWATFAFDIASCTCLICGLILHSIYWFQDLQGLQGVKQNLEDLQKKAEDTMAGAAPSVASGVGRAGVAAMLT